MLDILLHPIAIGQKTSWNHYCIIIETTNFEVDSFSPRVNHVEHVGLFRVELLTALGERVLGEWLATCE